MKGIKSGGGWFGVRVVLMVTIVEIVMRGEVIEYFFFGDERDIMALANLARAWRVFLGGFGSRNIIKQFYDFDVIFFASTLIRSLLAQCAQICDLSIRGCQNFDSDHDGFVKPVLLQIL